MPLSLVWANFFTQRIRFMESESEISHEHRNGEQMSTTQTGKLHFLKQIGQLGAITLATTFLSSAAQAHGFVCTSLEQNTQIEIHLTGTGALTRDSQDYRPALRAKLMIVKDITLNPKRQLVAKFSSKDGLLRTKESSFIGRIDPKHPDTSNAGKRIGGTRLGLLETITVEIDYSFQEKVSQGVRLAGQVTYSKTNGDELAEDFECVYFSDASKFENALQVTGLDLLD
jgi:hypothetical protein